MFSAGKRKMGSFQRSGRREAEERKSGSEGLFQNFGPRFGGNFPSPASSTGSFHRFPSSRLPLSALPLPRNKGVHTRETRFGNAGKRIWRGSFHSVRSLGSKHKFAFRREKAAEGEKSLPGGRDFGPEEKAKHAYARSSALCRLLSLREGKNQALA